MDGCATLPMPYNLCIQELQDGPVLFTRHGSAAGVLIHPDLWNQLIEILEEREDVAVVNERLAGGGDSIPLAEAEAELRRLGILDE